ncbi:hypothetical protein SteCoe_17893 [Stentor coeruleus]|uniref:AAA-ATPase-like domain-containing protein n=1 Tax=Stentor coeruleus TaxID=5963 RepID=A0A1R2BXT1_9CILI|nr:hypothetical protein SteCoe_17893 [Stentor coeruleus]
MFGRLIIKISSFNRTPLLRCFAEIESTNERQTIFPYNVERFKELVPTENIFIDKSLLIEKLLNSCNRAFLFTRPRRWGKSLNIKMLDTFFRADIDEKVKDHDFNSQSQKKLFNGLQIANSKIYRNPITGGEITSQESDLINFQGQFPVINIKFND